VNYDGAAKLLTEKLIIQEGSTKILIGYTRWRYQNSGRDQSLHRDTLGWCYQKALPKFWQRLNFTQRYAGWMLPIQHAYFGGRAAESHYQMMLPT
jgi:hypothetical protein